MACDNGDEQDGCYHSIIERLRDRYGADFSLYRESTVKRRMGRRLSATGMGCYCDYLSALDKDPDECERLLQDLTIKVSRFFRNGDVFDALRDVVFPKITREKKLDGDNTIRVWSAGCSHGEEAYSVAITLMESLRLNGESIEDYHVSIFGTDIDDAVLAKASMGEYFSWAFKETDEQILSGYFTGMEAPKMGRHGLSSRTLTAYRVNEGVRGLVHFCRHDIASSDQKSPSAGIFTNYDVILCRNLLIYFSRPLQDRAFSNLVGSLNPGGYLVLGKAEVCSEEARKWLVPFDAHKRIYRKPKDAL